MKRLLLVLSASLLLLLSVPAVAAREPAPAPLQAVQGPIPDAIIPHALYVLVVDLERAARRGTVKETADASAAVKAWVDANGWVW